MLAVDKMAFEKSGSILSISSRLYVTFCGTIDIGKVEGSPAEPVCGRCVWVGNA